MLGFRLILLVQLGKLVDKFHCLDYQQSLLPLLDLSSHLDKLQLQELHEHLACCRLVKHLDHQSLRLAFYLDKMGFLGNQVQLPHS